MRTSPNAVPDINESVELACMTSVPLVLPLSSAEPAPALATRAASARLARDADWLPRGAPSCEELGHGDTSSMPSMPAGRRLGAAACAYGSPARCHGCPATSESVELAVIGPPPPPAAVATDRAEPLGLKYPDDHAGCDASEMLDELGQGDTTSWASTVSPRGPSFGATATCGRCT